MKKVRKLELENTVLRQVIAEVQKEIKKENLVGEHAYPRAVGAIRAITDEQRIKENIQWALRDEDVF